MHALLIDGENVSSRHAERIRAEVPPDCAVRQVYGDVARLNGWVSVPWLTPVHVTPAPNAADIALAVEAMELALTRGCNAFTLVTSDGGLATLANRLRAFGHTVTVLGEGKAKPILREAAYRFVELAPPPEPVAALPAPPPVQPTPRAPAAPLSGLTKLDSFVRDLVGTAGAEGLRLDAINPEVHRRMGTKIATLPEKSWRAWFTARPHLFALDPRGPDARVRLANP